MNKNTFIVKILGGLGVAAAVTLGATGCSGMSSNSSSPLDRFNNLTASAYNLQGKSFDQQIAVLHNAEHQLDTSTWPANAVSDLQTFDGTLAQAASYLQSAAQYAINAPLANTAYSVMETNGHDAVYAVRQDLQHPSSTSTTLAAANGAQNAQSSSDSSSSDPAPDPATGGGGAAAVPADSAPAPTPESNPAPAPAPAAPPTPVAPAPAPVASTSDGIVQNTGNAPAGIVSTLSNYFGMINNGQYAGAYDQLGPQEQGTQTESQFASGMTTTQDSNINIVSSIPQSDGSDLITVSFTSHQSAASSPNGAACDNWTIQYRMINQNGTWLINSAVPQGAAAAC